MAKQHVHDPECFRFGPSGGIPNHPVWPVLVYRSLWSESDNRADRIEHTFKQNGWVGCWRWSVYDFHHFHSNAHECLGIAEGTAALRIGGPSGVTLHVSAGDLIILPAGTGHKNEGASSNFLVVGAYPPDQQDCDLQREESDDPRYFHDAILRVPKPSADPAIGEDGPLMRLWPES